MGNPFTKKATSGGGDGDFENPPAGNHPAVLVAIIDIGTQSENFKGEVKSMSKVFFVWELTAEKMSTGKNFTVGQEFTNSLNVKAALYKMLTAWRGPLKEDEEYDYTERLGKPCLVSVNREGGESGDKYAKFAGCGKPVKGMTVPKSTYTPFTFAIGRGCEPDKLPAWLPRIYGKTAAEKIKRSDEWIELCGGAPPANGSAPEEFPHGANVPAAQGDEEAF